MGRQVREEKDRKGTVKAIDYVMGLKQWCALPWSTERPAEASRSEVKRWLRKGAVIINGKGLDVNDEVEVPVTCIVFFPNGKRKTTMLGYQPDSGKTGKGQ